MNHSSRKTFAFINLPALVSNYNDLANLAPHSKTMPVIKADAYGHGAVEVAKTLQSSVPAFAVALIDEALVLRHAGITLPILILEGAFSSEDFTIAKSNNFWLMLHNLQQINWLNNLSTPYTEQLWLKVDTGMHRLGLSTDQATNVINNLPEPLRKNLVLCTHFSNADELDNTKTLLQIKQFNQLNQIHQCKTSLANSAGIINWPQSHGDFNRLGIALYGSHPSLPTEHTMKLKPVMTLTSTIIGIRTLKKGDSVGYGETWQAERPSVIATVAIGYGDGYPRNAKAGTPVFINGQLASIAGRVSMDMITIDVTDVKHVELGDKVELWGENLAIETVAAHLDTINYELLTRVSARVPKQYIY